MASVRLNQLAERGVLQLENDLDLSEEARIEKELQERSLAILAQRPKCLQPNPQTGAIRTLETPENAAELQKLALSGIMFKKERNSSNWRKFHYTFDPKTIELQFYKSQEEFTRKMVKNTLPVSWVWAEKIEEEDILAKQQIKSKFRLTNPSKIDVCTYRVSVFSPRGTFIISTNTDEELFKLLKNLENLFGMTLNEEELAEKRKAAAKMGPLQHQQLKMEREQYKLIIQSLQQAGIFPDRPSGKKREGYMDMLKADGTWKKYYCVLFSRSLTFFNLDDKVMLPRGVILLASITSIRILPVNTGASSSDEEDSIMGEKIHKRPFAIHTPLKVYRFRVRHEEALKDWIGQIQQFRNPEKAAQSAPKQNEIPGEPVLGQKYIEYTVNGNIKFFKIKKDEITIGRSSKADVCLPDVKVSRNHGRIEIQSNGVPVFADVGSSTGSFVNGQRVIRVPLKADDKIQLGNSTLFLRAGDKK